MQDILRETSSQRLADVYALVLSAPPHPDYLHWDKLRHLTPPEGVSHREWWLLTKLGRSFRRIPLTDPLGAPFSYATPDEASRLLHFVDQRSSGEIAMPEVVIADDQARRHYLVNSLMEEAIQSSQLEGATTSRPIAKELLQSGRAPRDRSERMIVNNYDALEYTRDVVGDELMPEHVLEIQRILTNGTLENPEAAGRLQRPNEERVVVLDLNTGESIHVPPPADQLEERLVAMCAFANGSENETYFLHPVVRSILLHFWLAYDHPFVDGNGRSARLLFYWSMRKDGYRLTEYLSISRILRQAPSQYMRSFLLTETDGGDATYFVLYQLRVIQRAIEELHEYLARKIREVREVEDALHGAARFNHRQLALLSDAIRDPQRSYTFKSHATAHRVTVETARTDLLQLHRRGLVMRRKSGRQFVFVAQPDLTEQLAALS